MKQTQAIPFDLEKEKIFDRRRADRDLQNRTGLSSTDIVLAMTKAVDPELKEILKINRKLYLKSKKRGR